MRWLFDAAAASRLARRGAARAVTLESYALEQVRPGQVVGLGSGRAAERFVRALGARVGEGLEVRGVATSEATAKLARALAIPLVALDEVSGSISPSTAPTRWIREGGLIKGYGGALLREKVVATSAARA